jgi:hypothetical protein
MTDNRELPRQIVVTPTKSVGISIILTVLFGPLGMFYSTIWGAIIMLIIYGVVGMVTLGYGLMITHPICVIWGALAAHSYNKKLLEGFRLT